MNRKTLYSVLIILVVVGGFFLWCNNFQTTFSHGDEPMRSANKGCVWKRDIFEKAGITAFVQSCMDPSSVMAFSDADKKVIGKWQTNPNYEFTIQVFAKEAAQKPIDVVKEWYAKLSADQQKVCEIQEVDVPVTYFPDGSPNFHERPNPTEHKIRYAIGIRPEMVQQISNKYGGDPGSGSGYDYMCGHDVGATWSAYPPYFEFDDRSPYNYLLVGSYAFEAPSIDLNSIRF